MDKCFFVARGDKDWLGDKAVDHPHPGVATEGEICVGVGDDAFSGCSGYKLGRVGWKGRSSGCDGGEQGEVHLVGVDVG